MRNIKFKGKLHLKLAGVVLAVMAAFIPASSSFAWGPDRPTHTMDNPAEQVTFNSITNNPGMGDERNFVRIREAGTQNFYDEVNVEPGKEYEVYVFFHNNAKSSLNLSANNQVGIAKNVKLKASFPQAINANTKGTVSATISADNATPNKVWDEAYMKTTSVADINLRYVANSAVIHSAGAVNGTGMSSAMFTDGVYLGYAALDGQLPGCSEFSGYITYKIKAEQIHTKVVKSVSKDGTNFYSEVKVKPGDIVTYKVVFENLGTQDVTNLTFLDKLPNGVTLVAGSTKYTSPTYPNGITMEDLIGQNGFNVGRFAAGGTATLVYQVKVNNNILDNVTTCGTMSYINQINVIHDKGKMTGSAKISIDKECAPGETPDIPTPPELPKTGPGEIAVAVVAVLCIAVGTAYWYKSQKEVNEIERKAAGIHEKKK